MTTSASHTLRNSQYVHFGIEQEYRKRPCLEKIMHIVLSIFNSIRSFFSMLTNIALSPTNPHCCEPLDKISRIWKKENEGLFVLIPGLNGNPNLIATSYAEAIKKAHPNKYEIRVPHVPHRGNCSIEKAFTPILSMVRDYIHKNPGKPVCLIGHSNGGRIAAFVETGLRNEDVNIKVTGIAGAFFGSSNMTTLNNYNIAPYIADEALSAEMPEGSNKAKEIISSMQKTPTKGTRDYTFYATANDVVVTPFSSSFPKVHHGNPKYHLVTGHDHASIFGAIQDDELNHAYKWMEEHKCPADVTST